MALKNYTGNLPETMVALRELSSEKQQQLWLYYFESGKPQLKPLWYKIQCELQGCDLDKNIVNRLRTYSKNPEQSCGNMRKVKYHIKPGTKLIKQFKGKEYIVEALTETQFLYNSKNYGNLSAIATEIAGRTESGYDFFGFNRKGRRDYDRTKDWTLMRAK